MMPCHIRTDSNRPKTRSRPRLEALEGRQLMSLGAEFTAPVNTTTGSAQFGSANASSSNGSSVAVWTDSLDIRAQRFNAAGQKTGPEILVDHSPNGDATPAVAMDAHGDFVVTWTQTQPGGDTNVLARRFNPAGAPVGGIVPVGVGTFKEHHPSVAMDARGDFIVAYTRNTNYSNDQSPDVFAKRYDVNNNLLQVVNVAVTPLDETSASVAMTPDGRFDVAWQQSSGNSIFNDVELSRYSASGALLGTNGFFFNNTANQLSPSVSVDNSGNAVVAWEQSDSVGNRIMAERVSASGVAGGEFTVALSTTRDPIAPKAALKRGGGGFVVVYESLGDTDNVEVAEVSASNHITTFNVNSRTEPAVSINGADAYLVTYTSNDSGHLNIRRRVGQL